MKTTIRIQRAPFDLADETRLLAQAAPGAIATFTGYVRAEEELSSLTLEHYPGMTEREIARHVEEAASRWPLLGATVIHRVGELHPDDAIVLVAVAAAHRAEAFAACEFLMDYLKTRAPFWKEERREAVSLWVEGKPSDDAAAKRWLK